MKIYLAARYWRHGEMQEVARQLNQVGHEVTSRWIWGSHQLSDAELATNGPVVHESRFAQEDLEDVHAADILVAFAEPLRQPTRGGRHVEFGVALALGKRLIVVGQREHVFHSLPVVEVVATTKELFAALSSECSATHRA